MKNSIEYKHRNPEGLIAALGDLLYGLTVGIAAKLAGNTTTTGKFLYQVGTGSASAAPSWRQINVSTDTTGVLPKTQGGAGDVNGIMMGNGSGAVSAAVAGTNYLAPSAITGFGYQMQVFCTSLENPADGTTYYYGWPGGGSSTDSSIRRVYIPKAGTIVAVYGWFRVGTAGTNETVTVFLRLNDTTNTTITSTLTMDNATTGAIYSKTDLSIAVVAGDFISLGFTTPTWGTNPVNVAGGVSLWINY